MRSASSVALPSRRPVGAASFCTPAAASGFRGTWLTWREGEPPSADHLGLEVVAATALRAVHQGVGLDEQLFDGLRRAVPGDEPGRDGRRFAPVGPGEPALDAADDGGRLVEVRVGKQQHELVATNAGELISRRSTACAAVARWTSAASPAS